MAHHEGVWTKVKEMAVKTPGTGVVMVGVALFNRAFSVSGINKRLDKQEGRLDKTDEKMTSLHVEQRIQGSILREWAKRENILVPEPEKQEGA